MDPSQLLTVAGVLPSLRVASKKALLAELCGKAAELTAVAERDIVEAVTRRERLGSTGVGRGIAIPHGKVAGSTRIQGVFARLERPIPFESLDGEPVDLAFLLIGPESAGAEHLKALASVARLLRDPAVTSGLRFARDASTILDIMNARTSRAA